MNQLSDYCYDHLNDFIDNYIQSNGIDFVIDNYIELREQYYEIKDAA